MKVGPGAVTRRAALPIRACPEQKQDAGGEQVRSRERPVLSVVALQLGQAETPTVMALGSVMARALEFFFFQ